MYWVAVRIRSSGVVLEGLVILETAGSMDGSMSMLATLRHHIFGAMEPVALVPSGFSISTHHFASAGSGDGAMAWMS
jgi:hypothetical protein